MLMTLLILCWWHYWSYADYIIVWGSTVQEHNDRLMRVLERTQSDGLKLNKTNVNLERNNLPRRQALCTWWPAWPRLNRCHTGHASAHRHNRCATHNGGWFIGKLIPNLSAKASCILHKQNDFKRTANHEHKWQKLKKTLSPTPVLTFFYPTKRIKVSISLKQTYSSLWTISPNHPVLCALVICFIEYAE